MFYLKSHVIERINTLTLPFDFELQKSNKRIQVRTLKCSLENNKKIIILNRMIL